jgi:hypothetical protein
LGDFGDGNLSVLDGKIGANKGKAIPLETWTDPEDSRRLRLADLKTIGT